MVALRVSKPEAVETVSETHIERLVRISAEAEKGVLKNVSGMSKEQYIAHLLAK